MVEPANRPPIDSGNVTRAVRNWSLAELMGLLERRGGSMKQLFNTFRFLWAWAFIFGSGYAPYLCALAVYHLWRGRAAVTHRFQTDPPTNLH